MARDVRLREFEDRLERAESDSVGERNRRENQESIVVALRETVSTKDKQLGAVSERILEYQLEFERLSREISAFDRNASSMRSELDSLKRSVTIKDVQLQTALQDLEHKAAELERVGHSLAASEQRVATLLAEGGSLKAVLVEKETRMQMMSEDLESLKRRVDKFEQALAASDRRIATLLTEVGSLRTVVTERDLQLSAARDQSEAQRARSDKLSYHCGQLEERANRLSREVDRRRANAEAQRAESCLEVAAYKANIEQLNSLIETRENMIVDLRAERESAVRNADTLQKAMIAQREQLHAARAMETDCRMEVSKGQERIAAIEAKCNEASQLLSQRDSDMRSLRCDAAEATRRFESLETVSRTLQIKLSGSLEALMRCRNGRCAETQQATLMLPQLLDLDGAVFVEAAYRVLLLRMPDAEGRRFYEDRLRSGVPKVQILAELSRSDEGSKTGSDIPGLKSAIRRQWFARAPIVGQAVAWAFNAESMSRVQTRVRVLRQLVADAVDSFKCVLEAIDQDVGLLRDLAVLPDRAFDAARDVVLQKGADVYPSA